MHKLFFAALFALAACAPSSPAPLPEIVGSGAVVLATGEGAVLVYPEGDDLATLEVSASLAIAPQCPAGLAILLTAQGADPEGAALEGAPVVAQASAPGATCPRLLVSVGGGLPVLVSVESLGGSAGGAVQVSAKQIQE